MALSPFSHHHGRKGRGGGGGGGGADFWDVIDPLEIALTVLEDAPTRARARDTRAINNTNVDWVETPEAHIFKVDLPGVGRNEIEVTIEDNRTLRISGERVKEEVREGDTWHVVERARGRFVRKFRLPKNADLEKITAEVNNGVLTIVVPKIEPRKKHERRHIEVSGPVADQAAGRSATQEGGSSAPPTPKRSAARQSEMPGSATPAESTVASAAVQSGQ